MFIHLYVFALGLGGIPLGLALSGNNQPANVMKTKFAWTEEDTRFYNSLINLSCVFGMMVGSLSGGVIIPWGRRKTIILFNIFGMASLVL